MALSVVLAALAGFLPETLAGYFIGKGMDKMLESGASLKNDLQDVIQETVEEFSDTDTRNYGSQVPFYHSVKILNELLNFRLMAPGDYDINQLYAAFENEEGIARPRQDELNAFYALFMSKVAVSENLKKLEIKETYREEVFMISRKLTTLADQVENLARQYTGDLEGQWKDRVDAYVKTLQDFKPATALSLLESLERSIQTSTRKPGQSFMAFLEYQKGQCMEFLGRRSEAFRAKLKAWDMDPANILFGQSAAINLLRERQFPELSKVCQELLKLDSYNPVVWALNTIRESKCKEFDEIAEQLPLIVSTDPVFRRVLITEAGEKLLSKIQEVGWIPNCLDYEETEVTIDGFNTAVFWLNTAIRTIFKIYYLDYYSNNQGYRKEMTVLNNMIHRFLEKTRSSELANKFEYLEYLLVYTEFSLEGTKEKALELEAIYSRAAEKRELMMLQTANALQLSGYFDKAIAILEGMSDLSTEGLLLLLYTYKKNEDNEGLTAASKRFAASISHFENRYLTMYLNLMVELKLEGLLDQFSKDDWISGKTFAELDDQKLVATVADLLFEKDLSVEKTTWLSEHALSSEDSKLVDILGSAFFAAEHYESALQILGRNLEGKGAGRELYQYIHATNRAGKDYRELLRLLESWRHQSPFSPQFCRLESEMRQDLMEWKTVADICLYYLKNIPDDSFMLMRLASSLHFLNDAEYNQKFAWIAERARRTNFKSSQHFIGVCEMLYIHGHAREAFDLLYPHALNPNAIALRGAYVKFVFNRGDKLPFFEDYDVAEEGHFVKYERDGVISYVELTEDALHHPVHQQFVGKKLEETVTATRSLSNLTDNFKILRIMNKYMALFEQILNQSAVDPYAGLPFASMKFDTENPGSFFEMMQKMFGDKNKITEETRDAAFDEYYRNEFSLTELIAREYQDDFITGYYHIIRFYKGITTIRLQEFINHPDITDKEMVIDYSSLLLFHQISKFHQYNFSNKFLISKYLVEHIRSMLTNLQYGTNPFNAPRAEIGKTPINDPSFAFLDDRKAYLTSLLNWIDNNCEVKLSDKTLDAISKANIHIGNNPMADFAISTYLLITDNPNSILISDDHFSLSKGLMPLINIISSEHYLKAVVDGKSDILNEFVRNRYINYSPNSKQLNEEFSKMISGIYSNYNQLLHNLSLVNSRTNAFTAIDHLKEIALKPMLTYEQILREMTNVLVNLLRYSTESFFDLFSKKVFIDFMLLGEKQDIAIMAVSNAQQIIWSDRQ